MIWISAKSLRRGLTAETVIDALCRGLAAFQMAATADYEAQAAVERELTLRLANLLQPPRRGTTIESGLFKNPGTAPTAISATGPHHQERLRTIDNIYRMFGEDRIDDLFARGLVKICHVPEEDIRQDKGEPSATFRKRRPPSPLIELTI
jgi:hypothetical protein